MATNLHIDEKLLARALKAGGKKTKRETVNEALKEYIRRREQLKILDAIGTVPEDAFWDPPELSRQRQSTRRNGNGR